MTKSNFQNQQQNNIILEQSNKRISNPESENNTFIPSNVNNMILSLAKYHPGWNYFMQHDFLPNSEPLVLIV